MPLNRKRNARSRNGHWWRGTLLQQINEPFRLLLDNRSWRRHPAPFSKTKRGEARRQERRFVALMDQRAA